MDNAQYQIYHQEMKTEEFQGYNVLKQIMTIIKE